MEKLCHRFDESYHIEPSNYEFIKTLDCSMHTSRILQDLVRSCLTNGVTFETGIKINKLLIDSYGKLRIKSLLCETQEGRSKRLKAKLFVFAVGEGFEPFLKDLQVRAKIKRSRSAMVVAYPALVDEKNAVGIKLFETESEQQSAMQQGLRRLLLLNVPSPIKYLHENLPNKAKLGLYFTPFGKVVDLIDSEKEVALA